MAKLVHVISVGTDDAYRVVMKDIHINPEHVVSVQENGSDGSSSRVRLSNGDEIVINRRVDDLINSLK